MHDAEPTQAVVAHLDHDGERYLLIACPVSRPALLVDLTPAELEVMNAWLTGAAMSEIADLRGVAFRTVANQIASVYRKFEVGSRNELQRRLQHNHDEEFTS